MGEKPDEIEREIEAARQRASAGVNQLEYRIKRSLDWRAQFERRPWMFVGTAFGLAFLLGWMFTPSRQRFD